MSVHIIRWCDPNQTGQVTAQLKLILTLDTTHHLVVKLQTGNKKVCYHSQQLLLLVQDFLESK